MLVAAPAGPTAMRRRTKRPGAKRRTFILTETAALKRREPKDHWKRGGQTVRQRPAARARGDATTHALPQEEGDGGVEEEHGHAVVEEAQHEDGVDALGEGEQDEGPGRAEARFGEDVCHQGQRGQVEPEPDPLCCARWAREGEEAREASGELHRLSHRAQCPPRDRSASTGPKIFPQSRRGTRAGPCRRAAASNPGSRSPLRPPPACTRSSRSQCLRGHGVRHCIAMPPRAGSTRLAAPSPRWQTHRALGG